MTGNPWIADHRCWTRPELSICVTGQKDRGLWGREGYLYTIQFFLQAAVPSIVKFTIEKNWKSGRLKACAEFYYRRVAEKLSLKFPLHITNLDRLMPTSLLFVIPSQRAECLCLTCSMIQPLFAYRNLGNHLGGDPAKKNWALNLVAHRNNLQNLRNNY